MAEMSLGAAALGAFEAVPRNKEGLHPEGHSKGSRPQAGEPRSRCAFQEAPWGCCAERLEGGRPQVGGHLGLLLASGFQGGVLGQLQGVALKGHVQPDRRMQVP